MATNDGTNLVRAAQAVRDAVHGEHRNTVHPILLSHDSLEQLDETIHDLCKALFELGDTTLAAPLNAYSTDQWQRLAERLAWHLSDALAVLKASGTRIVPTHGDDGTKALADFRSMIPSSLTVPRDYEEAGYRAIKRCMACASDVHTKCSGVEHCQCVHD